MVPFQPPNLKDPNPDNSKASAVQNERGAFTVHAFALCGRFLTESAAGGAKSSGKNPGWGDGMGGGRFKK